MLCRKQKRKTKKRLTFQIETTTIKDIGQEPKEVQTNNTNRRTNYYGYYD
ncbi:MAG: hypothetical protein VZR33_07515 [Methanosphaera sp.]|nr:hypothetical protein [Methanosphaera sp.]